MKDEDRVVLITGASSGIGYHCALHLHRLGYRVYGTSRRAVQTSGSDPGNPSSKRRFRLCYALRSLRNTGTGRSSQRDAYRSRIPSPKQQLHPASNHLRA